MTEQKKITLTPHQQEVFKKLKDFVDSECRVFILKGYAGTGKTTLMKSFIDYLKEREERYTLLASTGRAAKILRDITGTLASTIHSELYTFKDFNQDLDEKFDKVGNKADQIPLMDDTGQLLLQFDVVEIKNAHYSRCFYIIDESSMVADKPDVNPTQAVFGSGRLLKDLINHDSKGKFVFVGDVCQLPPVNSHSSPALSPKYFKEMFDIDCMEGELTQIMRQEHGNDIIMSASKIRDMYNNPPVYPKSKSINWTKFPLSGFKNITICPGNYDLLERYINDVKENGYENATMICYSNQQCSQLAHLVRPAFGMKDILNVGDLLIVTQNNYISGLVNGDMVKVVSIGYPTLKANLTFQVVEVEEISTKRRATQYMIMNILAGYAPNIGQTSQQALYIDFYKRMRAMGIKQKSDRFKEMMMTDPYLNALRANYGYAVTCHKSQGGEWKNVYLDIPRAISKNSGPTQFQWLYTAMTRAKEQLFIKNDFYVG